VFERHLTNPTIGLNRHPASQEIWLVLNGFREGRALHEERSG
jgi:hypothetical protein